MTITLQAVNELIQSLESAGELSIKERKYLDIMRWAVGVAGERDAALNAERVWETAMMEVCGEDGPASVASEIRALQVLRDTRIQALNSQVEQLAAENALRQEFVKICFRAAADGASLDGADIQEIGERLGLFGRETYQPVLHGYICGHEAGEDSVYVMKSAPATDAYLAGIKADGVEEFVSNTVHKIFDESDAVSALAYLSLANSHVKQLREVADK